LKPLGLGIIGMGVGGKLAPPISKDARINHIVLCDQSQERLDDVAAKVDIKDATTDWQALIRRDDLDVIVVASPDHLHHSMAIAALEAGKHVLCEKPMAMDLVEARQMIEAADRCRRKFAVNNVLRYFERFIALKKMVDDGVLGTIYAAEGDYIHNTLSLIRNGWRGPHRRSVMTGGGVHLIDLLRWIVGEVDQAFGYATRGVLTESESQSPDTMMSVLHFTNGAVGKAMANMAAQRKALHNFVLYGTKGVFINDEPDAWLHLGHDSEPQRITTAYGPAGGERYGKQVGLVHLLDCIEHDRTPLVDAREGARTLAVCDAINQSIRTGRPVNVQSV
jgi:predicted dehydrogenase